MATWATRDRAEAAERRVAELEAELSALRAAQPEDDGLDRCPDCEHRQTEHATPGAECVHAFCSCDQALTLVLATLSESSEGVERRDGA